MRFIAFLAGCALALGLLSPMSVAAAKPSPTADCNANARLTHRYTVQELQNALNTMPADIKEYTDCASVIQNQLLTQLGEGHAAPASATGSGGSFLPTPLIVVLAVLVLAAAGFGVLAFRRRGRR